MSPLVWYSIGVGVWSAWHREDRSAVAGNCHIAKTGAGYRVDVRHGHDVVVSVCLNHHTFTLKDAQQRAARELVDAAMLVGAPRVDDEIVRQRLAALSTRDGLRCQFVHAWPHGAGDAALCQCGRVTKGYARECGLRVPA